MVSRAHDYAETVRALAQRCVDRGQLLNVTSEQGRANAQRLRRVETALLVSVTPKSLTLIRGELAAAGLQVELKVSEACKRLPSLTP